MHRARVLHVIFVNFLAWRRHLASIAGQLLPIASATLSVLQMILPDCSLKVRDPASIVVIFIKSYSVGRSLSVRCISKGHGSNLIPGRTFRKQCHVSIIIKSSSRAGLLMQ